MGTCSWYEVEVLANFAVEGCCVQNVHDSKRNSLRLFFHHDRLDGNETNISVEDVSEFSFVVLGKGSAISFDDEVAFSEEGGFLWWGRGCGC